MTADDYIDLAIDKGMLYRRQRVDEGYRITFTKLFPTGDANKHMNEKHVTAVAATDAEAAERAFLGITNIT